MCTAAFSGSPSPADPPGGRHPFCETNSTGSVLFPRGLSTAFALPGFRAGACPLPASSARLCDRCDGADLTGWWRRTRGHKGLGLRLSFGSSGGEGEGLPFLCSFTRAQPFGKCGLSAHCVPG